MPVFFVCFFKFKKGLPPIFLRVAQTCKKESFFICTDDTDSMNADMNMKLFKVISPNNWATDNKEKEMKVFGGWPSL